MQSVGKASMNLRHSHLIGLSQVFGSDGLAGNSYTTCPSPFSTLGNSAIKQIPTL